MKLILMTTPDFFVEEDKILTALFEEGLDILHLRKPNTAPIYSERLLSLIPKQYYKQIVVHDNFYLKDEYGLLGIHLNSRNPQIPAGYNGHVSRSCHSLEELKNERRKCNYCFLSPIFNSISKEGYESAYTFDELKDANHTGIIDKKVMALGGISIDNIAQVKKIGFGGAVILGDLWNRFDIHSTSDYKELIDHFKLLRQATE